ncbi:hypothetical protein HD597_011253 [Nonomuraea thailandensis]|uniref:Uncharacterized protein n=1 Tax=Nonomuraea thailandensis TaxID=1188745 RepID=A0A9X2H0B2_9ACTN|nr:hypothetical protein [Nonomuraea thailandensis]MCP2364233.1 hypothetical protein [Nonomuraea thailandensis]
MRLGASLRVAAAALACFAVLTGCSGEPEPPPLAETTKKLVSDGDAVAAWLESRVTSLTKERADDPDRNSSCEPGKERRFYVAKGNFADPSKESPINFIGLLKVELLSRGYHNEVVDNLDLWEDDTSVAVLVNPETRLTFILFARLEPKPNIAIIGKTDCYSRPD